MTNKTIIKRIQRRVGVTADGIIGPRTRAAIAAKMGETEHYIHPTKPDIRSNRSPYGRAGKVDLVQIVPPYPLYYAGKQVEKISCHKEIAPLAQRALERVREHYGLDKIKKLGLDIYDGCYNNRSVRGGKSKSMHAWAIAFDFDAAHNGNKTTGSRARFAAPEYDYWWMAWMSVGARPFGLFNDSDYMHIEFTHY